MKILIPLFICSLIVVSCKTQQPSNPISAEQKAEYSTKNAELLLNNHWTLQIKNPAGKVVTSVQVSFTNQEANSCMGGDWNKVTLGPYKTDDKDFFPLGDEISYQIEGNNLTIGRNQICDAYLHLNADMSETNIKGDYYSYGKGGKNSLGSFTLKKITIKKAAH